MSKSSKKRRLHAKRRRDLDKVRGVALLDSVTPGKEKTVLENSPNPENAAHLKNYGQINYVDTKEDDAKKEADTSEPVALPIGSEGGSQKHVEFVLPRSFGKKAERYIFEKQARNQIDVEMPTISEGNKAVAGNKEVKRSTANETIDDILFPERKRKLEEKFEAVHQEEKQEKKVNDDAEKAGSEQPKKKKRKRGSIEKGEQNKQELALITNSAVLDKKDRKHALAKSEEHNNLVASDSQDKKAIKERKSDSSRDDKPRAKSDLNHCGQLSGLTVKEAATLTLKGEENKQELALITNSAVLGKKKRKHSLAKSEKHDNLVASDSQDKKAIKERKSDSSRVKPRATSFDLNHCGQLSGLTVKEAVKDKHGLRPRANSTDGELNLPQRGLCDERTVLQAHRWSDGQNYVHQVLPKGFVNLGNTCFLNSILQCLAYLPPFCQSLVTISEAKQKNGMNQNVTQGQKITSILCSLFQKVHGVNVNSNREGTLAPNAIVKALPTIGTCGSKNGYKFCRGRQEDAHEFLIHLLDAMHDGELRAAGINQHITGWRDRLPVTRLDETTFIHRIFGGYFRSQVRCRKCGYRSNTYDPFLDLSLEVSKKSSNSVLYALSEFTRKETLDSDNQWRCSGCKKYVCATKELTVFRPPLSLCIQLKRFTFDSGFGGSGFGFHGSKGFKNGKGKGKSNSRGGSKITKPIEFPAELDLPLSDARSCAYALTGVVIHVGGSASSGHYTAYVKKPGRKGTNQWYHADDSFVEPVSEKTVLRQKDAYVLFYCRKEVKLEFPSPPPRAMSAEAALEFGRARARARADSVTQDESRKKLLRDDADEAETEEISANSKTSPSANRVLEPVPVKDGAVKRVKTMIHPLASPPPVTSQPLKEAEIDTSTSATSAIRWTIRSSASFPDETVRTSQVLGKDLLKRLSEVSRATSKPDKLLHNVQSGKEERKDVDSSSSRSDELSADDEGLAEPAKTSHNNDDSSSASSSSDSVIDTEDAPVKKAKPKETSDSDTSNDSSQSEEEKVKGKARAVSKVAENHGKLVTDSKDSKDTESSSDSDATSSSDDDSQGSCSKLEKILKTKASTGALDAPVANATLKDDNKESNDSSQSDEEKVKGKARVVSKVPENHGKLVSKDSKDPESSSDSDATSSSDDDSQGSSSKQVEKILKTKASTGALDAPVANAALKDDKKESNRTRVVLSRADSRGRVKVMLGPRKKRSWKTRVPTSGVKGAAFDLLGNTGVSTWDDEDDQVGDSKPKASNGGRSSIVGKMDKQERSRKRKMHLDRWDALLDQGKTKKMKLKTYESKDPVESQHPKKNVFQRIQSGIQSMNRGKAKGLFRHKSKDPKAWKASF